MSQMEHTLLCPHCNAQIAVLVDPSVEHQEYIEDCEICCRPLVINYKIDNGELAYFDANVLEQ